MNNIKDFNFGYLAADGSLKLSKRVLFWYVFLAKSLLLLIGSMTSSVNGNAILNFFYPESDGLIFGVIFSIISLTFLQVYVFAKSLSDGWQMWLLKYFRQISIGFVVVDVVLNLVFSYKAGGLTIAALLMADVLMLLFLISDDYLKFYISYYQNREQDQSSPEVS